MATSPPLPSSPSPAPAGGPESEPREAAVDTTAQPGRLGAVGPGPLGEPPAPPAEDAAARESAAAAAVAERERLDRLERDLGIRERELAEMRAWRANLEQSIRPQVVAPDLDRLLFEQPAQTLAYVKEQAKAELRQEYQQDQLERQRQDAMTEFERSFYQSNQDLTGEQLLVNALFQREAERAKAGARDTIIDMHPDRARTELARLAREEILRVGRRAGELRTQREGRPVSPGPAVVEGGGAPPMARGARAPVDDAGPESLTDLLRARNEARRSAAARRRG